MTNTPNLPSPSRRQFVGGACAAVGTTALFSTWTSLEATRALAATNLLPGNDFKAVVCVFLNGGNDSYNMVIPTDDESYAAYRMARGEIAIDMEFDPSREKQSGILPLASQPGASRTFGLHPAMSEVQGLFNDGHLSVLANVGTLVEPTTIEQFKAQSRRLPTQLFSHADQQDQWQTSFPQGQSVTGWAGRMSDLLNETANGNNTTMNLSLSGTKPIFKGVQTSGLTIGHNGATSLTGKNGAPGGSFEAQYQMMTTNGLLDHAHANLFAQAYANQLNKHVHDELNFTTAFQAASVSTSFGQADISRNLQAVARTIAARNVLGMRRQVFFVELGGFDHHSNLIDGQYDLLRELSPALKEFWDALVSLGIEKDVLTYTASDFGRSLRNNGNGTDHAWGGHQMIMGGDVSGGQIFGSYPDASQLLLNDGLDVSSSGRMLPTTSVDQYNAELALWFGVPASELAEIIPNIGNFYNASTRQMPLGMVSAADVQW